MSRREIRRPLTLRAFPRERVPGPVGQSLGRAGRLRGKDMSYVKAWRRSGLDRLDRLVVLRWMHDLEGRRN